MSWQDELMSDYEAEAILTVAKQSDKIAELEKQVAQLKQEIIELKREISLLKAKALYDIIKIN